MSFRGEQRLGELKVVSRDGGQVLRFPKDGGLYIFCSVISDKHNWIGGFQRFVNFQPAAWPGPRRGRGGSQWKRQGGHQKVTETRFGLQGKPTGRPGKTCKTSVSRNSFPNQSIATEVNKQLVRIFLDQIYRWMLTPAVAFGRDSDFDQDWGSQLQPTSCGFWAKEEGNHGA